MNNLKVFEMQAEIYAGFWFLYSLYGVWKTRKTYEERIAEAEEKVEDLISMSKMLPSSKILPGLFVGVWLFCTMIDLIGVALLFSVVSKVDWIVKILTVILLFATITDLRELIGNLRAMDDEQHFRESLLHNTNRYLMTVLDIEFWSRFLLSLILLAGVY